MNIGLPEGRALVSPPKLSDAGCDQHLYGRPPGNIVFGWLSSHMSLRGYFLEVRHDVFHPPRSESIIEDNFI